MTPATEHPYIFSTGLNLDSNLEGFTNEIRNSPELPMGEGIQDMPEIHDPVPSPSDGGLIPTDFEDPDSEDEENKRKLGRSVAENGGKALARAVDRVASVIFAFIAHGEPANYRSDKTEMADLQEAFVEFMLETGFVMSPGWNLAVALASIYGFKAMGALHDRREYEKKMLAEEKSGNKESKSE